MMAHTWCGDYKFGGERDFIRIVAQEAQSYEREGDHLFGLEEFACWYETNKGEKMCSLLRRETEKSFFSQSSSFKNV